MQTIQVSDFTQKNILKILLNLLHDLRVLLKFDAIDNGFLHYYIVAITAVMQICKSALSIFTNHISLVLFFKFLIKNVVLVPDLNMFLFCQLAKIYLIFFFHFLKSPGFIPAIYGKKSKWKLSVNFLLTSRLDNSISAEMLTEKKIKI